MLAQADGQIKLKLIKNKPPSVEDDMSPNKSQLSQDASDVKVPDEWEKFFNKELASNVW